MGKVKLTELSGVSPFRKVAMGTWATAKDPSVYSLVEVDIEPVLNLIDGYSKKHGIKISLNHIIGKIMCYCYERRPELNGMIRGNKIYLRDHVALNYLINVPGEGEDKIKKATLSACTIHEAEKLTTAGIAREMDKKVSLVRKGKDEEMKKNLNTFKSMPWWAAKHYLSFASWLIYGLNWDLSFSGIPKDPFGSVMITNVGSLGIDYTWAPLVPYSRIPLVLTVCTISEKPWVIDGKVTIRKILPICITFDHRFIDGVHAAQMVRDFKTCISEPEKYIFGD